MKLTVCIGAFLLLLSGCDGVPVEGLPDCGGADDVWAAETCGDGTVQCHGNWIRTTPHGCMLHGLAAPGQPYEAMCVEVCAGGQIWPVSP